MTPDIGRIYRRSAGLARRLTARRRGGFSLIEILIAVVVLALGLLGVGAVFPVVIRSQRQSQDVINGQIASRAAVSYVTGRRDLTLSLRNLAYDMNLDGNEDAAPRFAATPWFVWSETAANLGSLDPATGIMTLPHPVSGALFVPITDRMFPAPFTPGIDPQYVWDIALRRKAEGGAQAVVFTRRIDAQVSVAQGWTLSHVLVGRGVASGQRRRPVATDPGGQPTGNGVGAYSRVRVIELSRWGGDDPTESDPALVTFADSNDGDSSWATSRAFRRAESVGQQLVDNMGNLYTVVGTRAGEETASDGRRVEWIRLSPELSRSVWRQKVLGAPVLFVMTPQPPASVTIVDIDQ